MGGPRARRLPTLTLLVLGMIVALVPARALASPPDRCADEAIRARLVAAGVPVGSVASTSGGAMLTLAVDGYLTGAMWFAYLPAGELVTTSRDASLATDAVCEVPRFHTAIRLLDAATDLRDCPSLRATTFDAAGAHEAMRRALSRQGEGAAMARGAERSRLALAVHGLAAVEIVLYLGLLGLLAFRGARREPRDALVAVGLTAVALAVRLLSAPRGPIEAGNGDFTHMVDAATWLRSGFDAYQGAAYPPAYRLVLTALFAVFGPSPELAFQVTTALGALTAIPAYLLGRRLGGSRAAGIVAGLALACYPPAVYFSNGIVLVVPAALLLTLATTHVEALVAAPSRTAAAAAVLALLLFVQCRLEALGIALLVAIFVLARVIEMRRVREVVRTAWAPVILGAALVAPYVALVAGSTSGNPDRATALALLASEAGEAIVACTAAFAVSALLARLPSLRVPTLLTIAAAAFAWAYALTVGYSTNAFLPSAFVVPEAPFFSFHADMGPLRFLTFGVIHAWTDQPAFLPVVFAPLLVLALAPRPSATGPRVPAIAVALVALPLAGATLTSFIATGIGTAEGLRLHVPFTGLVAAGVGVGAGRVLDWVSAGSRARLGLALALALVAFSPAFTHRALVSDSDRDQRAEYLFARDALARIPDGATVILPDQPLDLRSEVGRFASSADLFRTAHLLEAVAWSLHRVVHVAGLRDAGPSGPAPGDGWFFAGLDCYRAARPLAQARECEAARAAAGPSTIARDVPTRSYSVHSADLLGRPPAAMRFALFPLDTAALQRLRAPLRRFDDEARWYGLTGTAPVP